MTKPSESDEHRKDIRQQLQTQRGVLISMLNPVQASANGGGFPRSMTMRLLSGKSTMIMLILAKAVPLLLTRYIAKSSLRK